MKEIHLFEDEEWLPIPGYEGMYEVSSEGQVKSLNYNRTGRPCILKQGFRGPKGNYHYVELSKNGIQKKFKVSRLVATAFIPNPENKPDVDHINTNSTDDRVCNLRWVTRSENMNNPLTILHFSEAKSGDKHPMFGKFGKDNPKSVRVVQLSKSGEFIRIWDSMLDIKRTLGINNSSICRCCKGKLKSSGGFRWMYFEDYKEQA